jgi:hypothetical protein
VPLLTQGDSQMELISTFVQSIIPKIIEITSILLIIISIITVVVRSGFNHIIWDRLWGLVAGKADAQDSTLKQFLLEERDIERFRVITGIKIKSLEEMHKLIELGQNKDIRLPRFANIKRWIDFNSPQIVHKPSNINIAWRTALAILSLLFLICFIILTGIASTTITTDAYLTTNKSKITFKTDGEIVRGIFNQWSFNSSDCIKDKTELIAKTHLSEQEINGICNALNTNYFKINVKNAIRKQLFLLIIFSVIVIWLVISSMASALMAKEAKKIYNILYSSNATDS